MAAQPRESRNPVLSLSHLRFQFLQFLLQQFNLRLFYSAEWEWYDLETDDSRIDLLSTNLVYTF
ncbi:MAG: hypothetical protein P1R58_03100 [bacterium]|nr:hypothetical protein [bacterium]